MADRVPFIGPRPFREDDATLFFGRQGEIMSLAADVASAQIVLLYAPSGSGKSSLISAGLVPALRDDGFQVAQIRLNTLASTRDRRLDSLRAAVTESAALASVDRPSLLVLDQFEEIVSSTTLAEARALSQSMVKAALEYPQFRVLVSFREEYLARIIPLFRQALEINVGNFQLTRLTGIGATEAFRCSLEAVGFAVEPEAVELFLERLATRTHGVGSAATYEPLYLQLLGTQLWSAIGSRSDTARPADAGRPVVTAADVRGLVDFDQAIKGFFNSTIAEVCAKHGVQQKAARDWIDRELVTADETRSMVRREEGTTKNLPTGVLDDLVRKGLLRTEPRGDDLWLELAHDQLVERVREFNRMWWTGRVYGRLQDRDERLDIAKEACKADLIRWMFMRGTLWGLAAAIRDSGLRFSRRFRRFLPFVRKREAVEVDRLMLRSFVLGGSLVNAGVSLFRSATATEVPIALNVVQGLDSPTAKRKLRATTLNLGRTGRLLAGANALVTLSWVRLMSRLLIRSAVGAHPSDLRKRVLIGALLGTDVALGLLRWAIRYGLVVNCLGEEGQQERSSAPRREENPPVRRCTSLDEVASWSFEHPVLLVLDRRARVDAAQEFDRFATREVPFYTEALRIRRAGAAWVWGADLRRRGWRDLWRFGGSDAVSGLGFPAWGRRTYYVVESGKVSAWREVAPAEVPFEVRLDPAGSAPRNPQVVAIEKRFVETVTALVVQGEATPNQWGLLEETSFKARPLRGGRGAGTT